MFEKWLAVILGTYFIDIETLSILEGQLTPRVLGLAIEWAAMHKSELRENWQLARQNNPLEKIQPLE